MDPVKASMVLDIWADGLAPGVFNFADNGIFPYNSIIYICPCGCGQLVSLPIALGDKQERYWFWNGNRDLPTLQPSIRRLDGCHFHGYLTTGVWTFCSDSGQS